MSMIRTLLLLSLPTALLAGCAVFSPAPPPFEPAMVYKTIDLRQQRIDLTERYLCQNYQVCNGSVMIQPRIIVIHWTGTDTWPQAYAMMQSPQNASGELNNSVQFVVSRFGTVYQVMPSAWMARSVAGLDYITINIANVGGVDRAQTNLTQLQIQADAYLIHMLKQQYPSIDYVVGHYETTCFHKTSLWRNTGVSDSQHAGDPGPYFMRQLRAHIQDMQFDPSPCLQP